MEKHQKSQTLIQYVSMGQSEFCCHACFIHDVWFLCLVCSTASMFPVSPSLTCSLFHHLLISLGSCNLSESSNYQRIIQVMSSFLSVSPPCSPPGNVSFAATLRFCVFFCNNSSVFCESSVALN